MKVHDDLKITMNKSSLLINIRGERKICRRKGLRRIKFSSIKFVSLKLSPAANRFCVSAVNFYRTKLFRRKILSRRSKFTDRIKFRVDKVHDSLKFVTETQKRFAPGESW